MPTDTEAVSDLLTRLADPEPSVRREAASLLGESGDGRALYPLVRALRDGDRGVMQAATDALVQIGGEAVVYNLLPLLRDEDAAVRNMAVEILQQTAAAALFLMTPLVRDRDEDVRKFAVDLLGQVGNESVVPDLIGALGDANANVRAGAAESVGKLGDGWAVAPVAVLLNDSEEWVVFSAIEALGNLGSPEAVGPLTKLLSGDSEEVRFAVIEALGKIADERMVGPLIDLLPGAEAVLRNTIIQALIDLAGERLTEKLNPQTTEVFATGLLEALGDPEPGPRTDVVKAIGWVRDPRATIPLLGYAATLASDNEEEWEAVVGALADINDRPALEAGLDQAENAGLAAARALTRISDPASVPVLREAYGRVNREVRLEIIRAIGGTKERGQAPWLISLISDELGHARREAASALGGIGDPAAVGPLLALLDDEPYPDVRDRAVQALVRLASGEARGEIVAGLDRLLLVPRVESRLAAVKGLSKIGGQTGLAGMQSAVRDADSKVRQAGARALKDYGAEAVDALAGLLSDLDPEVRQAAAQSLGAIGDGRGVEPLLAALRDENLWVRCRAVESLAELGDGRAASVLIDLLDRDTGPVVIAAARALGALRVSAAKEKIRSLLEHEDYGVQEAALQALEQIEGTPGGGAWT
ncbi:MAG: HEAT repeat domain-containing protein [Nitrospirota bacterium]